MRNKLLRVCLLWVLATALAGCNPLAITALGIGANTGVSHALGGIIYKTFTAPVKTVELASLGALKDMDVSVVALKRIDDDQRIINAELKDRNIEILLEPLSRRTTRMRVIANSGLINDGATATEIVLQTERVLAGA